MRLAFATVAALALLPGAPARADQDFRNMLALLPQSALTDPTGAPVEYVNMQVAFRDAGPFRNPVRDMRLGGLMRPVEALGSAGGEKYFKDLSDIDPREIRYFAGFGSPPGYIVLWGFPDEPAAAAVIASLPDHGFSETSPGSGLLANGASDELDIRRREPFNPLIGPLGLTSVFARKGSALLHGSNSETVAGLMNSSAPALDLPSVQTLLAGLETEDATVREAIILSNVPVPGNDDPRSSLILSADLRKRNGQRLTLTAVSNRDCPAAEANLAAMSQILSPSDTRTVPSASGCAAVMIFGPFVAGDSSAQKTFDALVGGKSVP